MKKYLKLLENIKNNEVNKYDIKNVGIISIFGYQIKYDLKNDFQLITTKKSILNQLFINYYDLLKVIVILNN